MSRAIDPLARLRAADPAGALPVDDTARAAVWERVQASENPSIEMAPPRRRVPPTFRTAFVVVIVMLGLAAAALAAGGILQLGSPAPQPYSRLGNPHEGAGVLVPGSVRLVPIAAPDPAGGADWGMRELFASRGEGCLQIGRLLDGKLGAIGQDSAFGNDGRFHELPVGTEINGCALLDAHGRLFANVTADDRPASAWEGTGGRLGGCVPATAGPYEKGLKLTRREREMGARPAAICPQADLRNIYFGLLGPEAQSITYVLGGQRHTLDTVGDQGAYLFVTRASPHQLLNFANAGTADVVPVDGPIKEIHYRDGSTCHLTRKSWIGGSYACTPSLPEPYGYVPAAKPLTQSQVAAPLHVANGHDLRGEPALVVSFRARVPVTNNGRQYVLRWVAPGMGPGVYAGTSAPEEIHTGQLVKFYVPIGGLGPHPRKPPPGNLTGTVSLLQAGPGGLEGPGSDTVTVGTFARHVG